MAFTKNVARKGQFVAEVLILIADLVSAAEKAVIDMPAGTVIDDVYVAVDEVANPTTSAVIEFGLTGATATFVASQNIFTGQTLGGRAGAVTGRGYRFTAPASIVAKYTSGGGQATTGKVRLIVEHHYENEADFTVG